MAKADGDLHPKGNVRLLDGKLSSITPGDHETRDFWQSYKPTTNWSQGGPIIEREWDNLLRWFYLRSQKEAGDMWPDYMLNGKPVLVAFMQAFVASRLGNEVEVPDELKETR